MSSTKTRRSVSQQKRLRNLKKAIKRYGLIGTLDEEVEVGYGAQVLEALDGGRIERWMIVVHSEEYGSFGSFSKTRADAESDATGSIDDDYGKTPGALIDLDRGIAYPDLVMSYSRRAEKLKSSR